MVFVIFWVTLFPLISQAITGTKVSVGPPAFTPFVVPLALVLVALAGIGPIISWRRATAANLRRNFTFPVAVGAAHADRGAGAHERGLASARGGDVRARRIRARDRRPGAAPRHGRAPRRHAAMSWAVSLLRAGAPQPPPLRRLHRPRRARGAADRGRRLVLVPALPRRATASRPGRRASTATRSATSGRRRARRRRRSSSAPCSPCPQGGKPVTTLDTSRCVLPSARTPPMV